MRQWLELFVNKGLLSLTSAHISAIYLLLYCHSTLMRIYIPIYGTWNLNVQYNYSVAVKRLKIIFHFNTWVIPYDKINHIR